MHELYFCIKGNSRKKPPPDTVNAVSGGFFGSAFIVGGDVIPLLGEMSRSDKGVMAQP